MKTFEELDQYFRTNYGFSLILREEPYAMSRTHRLAQWIGANDPGVVLLRRTGLPPSPYPKSYGMIVNGGRRFVSLSTVLSNIKEGRELFIRL